MTKLWLAPRGGGRTELTWENLRADPNADPCEKLKSDRQIYAPQIRAILDKLDTAPAIKTELRALPGSSKSIDKTNRLLEQDREIEMSRINGANVYRLTAVGSLVAVAYAEQVKAKEKGTFDTGTYKESPDTEKTT